MTAPTSHQAGIVNVACPIGTRDGTLTRDAKMVNAMPERTEVGMAAVKRPGLALSRQLSPGVAQGLFDCAGVAYALNGDTAFALPSGANITFPLPGVAGQVYQSLDNYAVGFTLVKNASALWVVNGGAATKVTNVNYPPITVPGITELDGTTYVMTPAGRIYGSVVTDPTSWSALNFAAASASFGAGIAITKHLNYIVGFYDKGMQFFYDAENPTGSPLLPVENAAWAMGLASAGSVAHLVDNLYFMSKGTSTGRSITCLSGLQPTVISDPNIDRILNRDSLIGVSAYGIRTAGHSLYILRLPASNITLAYDEVYQLWTVWTSMVGGTEVCFSPSQYVSSGGRDFLQDASSGATYTMQPSLYLDVAATIRVLLRTSPWNWGTLRRKFLPEMHIVADTLTTTVAITHSDDDYATQSVPRTVDLSTTRKILRRCGSALRRSWDLVHSDNTPLRVFGFEIEIQAGAD